MFSETKQKAMAISPKCASTLLSIPGATFIIYKLIQDYRLGRGSTAMQRALVGMSCVDILSSIGWFLSSWAAPKGSFVFAVGNDANCSFQGLLLQIAIGTPLYNAALIWYYLLVIKYNWTNDDLLKIEPWIHGFIWIWCIGTSETLLSLDLLNFVGPVCWVGDPPECWDENPPDSCGEAKLYATAMFCIPL